MSAVFTTLCVQLYRGLVRGQRSERGGVTINMAGSGKKAGVESKKFSYVLKRLPLWGEEEETDSRSEFPMIF